MDYKIFWKGPAWYTAEDIGDSTIAMPVYYKGSILRVESLSKIAMSVVHQHKDWHGPVFLCHNPCPKEDTLT